MPSQRKRAISMVSVTRCYKYFNSIVQRNA